MKVSPIVSIAATSEIRQKQKIRKSNALLKRISMSTSGMNITYHQGVIKCLQDEKMINEHVLYSGTSGGAIVSALTACDVDPKFQLDCTKDVFKNVIIKGTEPIDEIIEMLCKHLPDNAGELCSDTVKCYMCKIKNFVPRAYYVTKFKDKQEVIDAITSSCYIPYLLGTRPYMKYKNEPHIDGGLLKSNRMPLLSPFMGYENEEGGDLYIDATGTRRFNNMDLKKFICYGSCGEVYTENTPFRLPATLDECDEMFDSKFKQGYEDTLTFLKSEP